MSGSLGNGLLRAETWTLLARDLPHCNIGSGGWAVDRLPGKEGQICHALAGWPGVGPSFLTASLASPAESQGLWQVCPHYIPLLLCIWESEPQGQDRDLL